LRRQSLEWKRGRGRARVVADEYTTSTPWAPSAFLH